MRIVIAPDKFKKCLTAANVAGAIADGLLRVDRSLEVDLCPMADGGEGTVETLVQATGGKLVKRTVTGPRPGMKVDAIFGLLGNGQTAVIEMASASGLHLLEAEQRNPMETTTYGTGELLRAAVELGAREIILGIGGSATNDSGLGCAQACGATITLDDGSVREAQDAPLCGRDLARVRNVTRAPGFGAAETRMLVACDVTNLLYGPGGAAPVFGPQKGATPEQVAELDYAAQHLAETLSLVHYAQTPGAGVAGGMGFGMLAFFGATLRPGVELVIDAVKLRERLAGASLCITAEGSLDQQSLAGKTPIGVARLCRQMNIPCIALAGTVGDGLEAAPGEGLTAWFPICSGPMTLEQAIQDAAKNLANTAANVMRTVLADF